MALRPTAPSRPITAARWPVSPTPDFAGWTPLPTPTEPDASDDSEPSGLSSDGSDD